MPNHSSNPQPGPGRILLASAFTLLLSFVAGITDAVGFGQTGEFVSFMSGNTTRVGISFATADPARGKRLLIVILLFVLGNALGAVVSRLSRTRRATGLLLYVATLLALAAGLPAFATLPDTLGFEHLPGAAAHLPADITLPSLILILLAMGALNAVVESIAGVGLGITYVTGALAGAQLNYHVGRAALWLPASLCATLGLTILAAPSNWQSGRD